MGSVPLLKYWNLLFRRKPLEKDLFLGIVVIIFFPWGGGHHAKVTAIHLARLGPQ
jgi:hypothetical protein